MRFKCTTSHILNPSPFEQTEVLLMTLFRLICFKNHMTRGPATGDLTETETVWLSCERHPALINLRINPIYHLILAWEPGLWALSGLFLGASVAGEACLDSCNTNTQRWYEKSWQEVPCFYFLFTKNRLTPECRNFPRRWQPDLFNMCRLVVMETNALLFSESWKIKQHSVIISKRLQIMTMDDRTEILKHWEMCSILLEEAGNKRTTTKKQRVLLAAPDFPVTHWSLPWTYVPDRWARRSWWHGEQRHKAGDGPASALVHLHNNNVVVLGPRLMSFTGSVIMWDASSSRWKETSDNMIREEDTGQATGNGMAR